MNGHPIATGLVDSYLSICQWELFDLSTIRKGSSFRYTIERNRYLESEYTSPRALMLVASHVDVHIGWICRLDPDLRQQ